MNQEQNIPTPPSGGSWTWNGAAWEKSITQPEPATEPEQNPAPDADEE